jgi:hypothetical protein
MWVPPEKERAEHRRVIAVRHHLVATDADFILENNLPPVEKGYSLHPSFTEWLLRMHHADGWPVTDDLLEEDENFYLSGFRVKDTADIERKYGPLDTLLAPIVPKPYQKLGGIVEW